MGSGTEENQRSKWSQVDDQALIECVLKYENDWTAIGTAMASRENGSKVTVEDCIVRFAEKPMLGNGLGKIDAIGADDKMDIISAPETSLCAEPSKLMIQELLNEYLGVRLTALEKKVTLRRISSILVFLLFTRIFVG